MTRFFTNARHSALHLHRSNGEDTGNLVRVKCCVLINFDNLQVCYELVSYTTNATIFGGWERILGLDYLFVSSLCGYNLLFYLAWWRLQVFYYLIVFDSYFQMRIYSLTQLWQSYPR